MTDPPIHGVEPRQVTDGLRDGRPTRIITADRRFGAAPEAVWQAITDPARLPLWFAPVTGEFRQGGRYAIEGNASGEISRCDPPAALDLTWDFGDIPSWLTLRLDADGGGTRLTLCHEAPGDGTAGDHWGTYGPGAGGIGWDMVLHGLGLHLDSGTAVAGDAGLAWMASDEGRAFIAASADAWRAAHVAAGADLDTAAAMARRTVLAYTEG